jgi:hypothetical protein
MPDPFLLLLLLHFGPFAGLGFLGPVDVIAFLLMADTSWWLFSRIIIILSHRSSPPDYEA